MKPKIFQKDILPSVLWFVLLFLVSRIIDQFLHSLGAGWVGRYLGYPGTLFIILSFVYSLRKKKIFVVGKIKNYLSAHEIMAWVGSLMILIHAGIHLHAALPWVALASMLVVVISGFTGGYLQKIAQNRLNESRKKFEDKGLSAEEIEEVLYLDSLTVGFMKKWRTIHLTITSFFTSLALFHILSIFWFNTL